MNAHISAIRRTVSTKAVAAAALLSVPMFAMAQTDPFTTAVADITGKVTSYGGALVGLAAVGVVFMIGIKYVKKIRSAA